MKKLLASVLAAAVLCAAAAACAATYNAGTYYTLDYDDSFTLDDTTYTDESHASYTWLFRLFDAQMTIDASWDYASGYAGVNMYEMNAPEREAYVADMLALFADNNAAYVDDITSVSGYPFYIFSIEGDEGAYYYAETLINGDSASLCAYYQNEFAMLDDALLETLEEVLITIRPVEEQTGDSREP